MFLKSSVSLKQEIKCDRIIDFIRILYTVQPQPKQEWSRDDEQYLLVCKNALAKYQTTNKWDASIISSWLEDKLKSLRQRKGE